MEYNIAIKEKFKKIGERIVKERKAIGCSSQEKFIELLDSKYDRQIGRNTLSSLETGTANHFDGKLLAIMCEAFKCDIGYLLCEYDCKRHIDADVHKVTHLSEKSIANVKSLPYRHAHQLIKVNSDKIPIAQYKEIDLLNDLLSDAEFITLLSTICDYKKERKKINPDQSLLDSKAFAISRTFMNIIDK